MLRHFAGAVHLEMQQRLPLKQHHILFRSFSQSPTRLHLHLPLPRKQATDSPNLHDCTPRAQYFSYARCISNICLFRYRDFRPVPPVSTSGARSDFGSAFDNAGELLSPLLCVLHRLGTDQRTATGISRHSAEIAGALARVLVGIDVDVAEAALALLMVLQQQCSNSKEFCTALLATQTSEVVTSKPPFSSSSIISSISGVSSGTVVSISTGSTVTHCLLTACISTNDLHAAAAMLCVASLALNHVPAASAFAAAPQTLSTMQMVCGRMLHYASSSSSSSTLAAASLMLSALLSCPSLSLLRHKLSSFASPFTSVPPLSAALHVLTLAVSRDSLQNSSIGGTSSVSMNRTRVIAATALAYFACHLSPLWDSFISSSSSVSSSSSAASQLTLALAELLASAPCQVLPYHFHNNFNQYFHYVPLKISQGALLLLETSNSFSRSHAAIFMQQFVLVSCFRF